MAAGTLSPTECTTGGKRGAAVQLPCSQYFSEFQHDWTGNSVLRSWIRPLAASGPAVDRSVGVVFGGEVSAPSVKERMVFVLSQRQSAAGLVAPDDHENFERLTDALDTGVAREVMFDYSLGQDVEPAESLIAELPGNVRPQISESYQREFYRHWLRAITELG